MLFRSIAGKDSKPAKSQLLGPFKFTHAQFEKDGIIMETNVPENRCVSYDLEPEAAADEIAAGARASSSSFRRRRLPFFCVARRLCSVIGSSPTPGAFLIALH